MTTWTTFAEAAPETAAVFHRRLEATGLALMATIRRDGSPRISPLEPLVAAGRLWLGSMPGSRKGDDLRRDPRVCLHSATVDKEVGDGDAKLWGRAIEVADGAERAVYVEAVRAASGTDLDAMPGGFDLFWLDLTAASSVQLGADGRHLRFTAWEVGGEERVIERR
jgi:nitroimidazol reductase NimA-like FMN-containing flavoprotein (pyridoxamine 5'-phosphate oxidase superfamily)